MSEEIKVKVEPADPEYDLILAGIKSEPDDDIPDGFFDDIVNDKELDKLIDNVSDQVEDRKPTILPPAPEAERADASPDESSDSNRTVDMQLCMERIKELKHLLKHGKKNKRKKDSSHDKSQSRRRRRSSSRHSRDKTRSKKRSRSRSVEKRRRRNEDTSSEREDIQPLKVRKIKDEKIDKQVVRDDVAEEQIEETEETRRERVIKMCVAFIKTFLKTGERPIKTRFFYTPSVIPLGGVDHLLEYRSPLNHITNVQFKFNSPSAHVDIQQFGLKSFTDPVTNVSKEIGFDVPQLMDKLTINELPKALKPIQSSKNMSKDGKVYTPFFTDAASQTEEMSCDSCIKRKLKTFAERGVMAVPMITYKAVQTETEQELPLMNNISLLNSSQLLAMNDFLEIIRAPAPTNPNELYRLREKLVEIFNASQGSCMMATNVGPAAPIQQSPVQRERSLQLHNTPAFNIPMQTQTQNQYNINNHSNIPQPHYGGVINQPNTNQFFNRGPSTSQNHAFSAQSAHMNMNMQYPFQSQNGQIQQHYPQLNMPSNSQYHPPQPVPPPKIRRDDPRHRGKEIDVNSAPPAPRSKAAPQPRKPTLSHGTRNFSSSRR